MLPLPTLPTLTAAISLPGSGDGRLPSPSPDGPTAPGASGPDHVHVNLSPRQAQAAGLMTSGTSGPISTGSLTSVVLKSSLANKLRQRTDLDGSILYRLTLKDRATPKLQSIFALRASARPTSDNAFTGSGWPTPTTRDHKDGGNPDVNVPLNALLGRVAWLAGWATPTVGFQDGCPEKHLERKRKAGVSKNPVITDLSMQSRALAGWPTPQVADINHARGSEAYAFRTMGRKNPPANVALYAHLAGWPTPTVGNASGSQMAKDAGPTGRRPDGSKATVSLNQVVTFAGPARLTVTGELLIGSTAGTKSGGQLNPEHSRWLMGYPKEWARSMPGFAEWQKWQVLMALVSVLPSPTASAP